MQVFIVYYQWYDDAEMFINSVHRTEESAQRVIDKVKHEYLGAIWHILTMPVEE